MRLLNNSLAFVSWLDGNKQGINNHESTILETSSSLRQNQIIQKQTTRRNIYSRNCMLIAICCCVITQLSLIHCKSTQLESEELHNINEKHNLPEHDITGISTESEIKPKAGCVCNEILCVMSRHNTDDQREIDSINDGTQITRIIEGPRPPRQSASNEKAKYGLNSIEYRVADATNRFGLLFLNNLGTTKGNTIYSPVSLQAILNMLYLGAKSNSSTSRELSQSLGYDEFNLLGKEEPHQGLYNIYKDITDLLSLNSKDTTILSSEQTKKQNETTNIDTTNQSSPSSRLNENAEIEETPGSAQLNFTMTNLLLTNKNLVDINEEYHTTLNKFYKVKLAQFKRQSTNASSSPSSDTKNEQNLNLSSPDPVVLEVENEKQLADSINNWVSNNTNHKIEKLVEEKDLPLNDLALALVNSAHFQASWLDKFDESQTREQYFSNEGRDDDRKLTPFMRKTSDFGYAQFVPKPNQDNTKVELMNSTSQQQLGAIEAPDLDCQALEIPFSIGHGKELGMLILLPRQRQGLDKLQRSLTWSTLRGIYNALEEEKVQVELPKFTFEESYDVKKILERMGIRSVFDPSQASLTEMLVPKETKGVNNGITFSVDKILHKAKVEVHESGAEAAASTYAGVLLRASLYVRPTPKFIADHPFIFIIRHNKSNLPLFMGRVNQF